MKRMSLVILWVAFAINVWAAETTSSSQVEGVVVSVNGGRVTLRLTDGRLKDYSLVNATLSEGQHVRAEVKQRGDAQILINPALVH
jgi:hypothetical protein